MGRKPRLTVPGLPHHITQHGNANARVFFEDCDYDNYIAFFGKAAARHNVDVWAYCLMTNHVHIVAVPRNEGGIPLLMHDANTCYVNWFNRRNTRSGHLWQARYYSCVMDESHLWAALRYVERNPVRAGMVKRAEEYRWSSAAAHCGLRRDLLLSDTIPSEGTIRDWKSWIADEDLTLSATIRNCTRLGCPCGALSFVLSLERLLDRVLVPKKIRQPRASSYYK